MKVVYIAKAKIPSNSANSVHVMKISEAFSNLNSDFTLLIPEEETLQKPDENCYAFYGVRSFDIQHISSCGPLSQKKKYGFALLAVKKACMLGAEVIVTRDPLTAFFAVLKGRETVLDLHGDLAHLCGRAYRMIKWKWFINHKNFHPVMITDGLRKYYTQKYGVPGELMTVLPDGYTADDFERLPDHELLAGKRLQIGYCGSFFKGKGLDIIYEMAKKDPVNTYNLYGGTKEDAEKTIGAVLPENVLCWGHIPNVEVPAALLKQDVLLLPNQDKQVCKGEDIGKVTSPLKMFEYMASGRVIAASDLPVLREVLNEENCYFAKADDADSWLTVFSHILKNKEEARKKAFQAKEDVKEYTWKNRAGKMLLLAGVRTDFS